MAWEEEFDASSDEQYVPAVFARSMEEAEELRQLLEDHGIEAVLGDESDSPPPPADPDTTVDAITHGVAVLVPEMYLDEASEVIADREDADEFEPEDEEDDEEEDDDEFAIGDEEDGDGFFQIEKEEDEEGFVNEDNEDDEDDEFLDDEDEGDDDDDDDDEGGDDEDEDDEF